MAKNPLFVMECQRFAFLLWKTICLFYFNSKTRFILFWFLYFLAIFDRNGFYFPFDHSRIENQVSKTNWLYAR
jgi:hypothetical protein